MNTTNGRKPAPQTPCTDRVSRFVTRWAQSAREQNNGAPLFVLDGSKVSDAEIGAAGDLLPVFAWHADNLYSFGMRARGFGLEFPADDGALLKRRVNLDKTDRSISEVLLFVLEALEDARAHLPRSDSTPSAVELRGLVSQFALQMSVENKPAARLAA